MIALTASAIRDPKLNKKKAFRPGQSAFKKSPGLLATAAQVTGRRRGESDARFHGLDLTTDELGAALAATKVAQTSKSAVSRVSQPASPTTAEALPIWKSATQQVWKPALQQDVVFIRIQKFAPINKTFMDNITD
jgi:hypothetical protein